MAHFARLKNNIVVDVVVIDNNDIKDNEGNESEEIGIKFCQLLWGDEFEYKQTSFNSRIRKNFAGINFVYDESRNAFISPKPEGNYLLNEDTCKWEINE